MAIEKPTQCIAMVSDRQSSGWIRTRVQCKRSCNHGIGGLFCKQHAKDAGEMIRSVNQRFVKQPASDRIKYEQQIDKKQKELETLQGELKTLQQLLVIRETRVAEGREFADRIIGEWMTQQQQTKGDGDGK